MNVAKIINSLPGSEDARYLEVGVFKGATFNEVRCADKHGVDPWPEAPSTHHVFSDEFFRKLPVAEKYDFIYIDGLHEFTQVVRDYEHAREHLSSSGLLFMHDLVPVNAAYAVPEYCGDVYRLLHVLVTNYLPKGYESIWSLVDAENDAGLTMLRCPPSVRPYFADDLDPEWVKLTPVVSYEEFKSSLSSLKRVTVEQMTTLAQVYWSLR